MERVVKNDDFWDVYKQINQEEKDRYDHYCRYANKLDNYNSGRSGRYAVRRDRMILEMERKYPPLVWREW